jgi:ribosome modulation factor
VSTEASDPVTKAFKEGKEAALAGKHVASCPYVPPLADAWCDGWHCGAAARSKSPAGNP